MSRLKKINYALIYCLTSLLIYSYSYATHYYVATLDELVRESDVVFMGEVKTDDRTWWGYRKATLRTIAVIKGNALSEMQVKYGKPWYSSQTNVPVLTGGKQYLFFLKERGSEFLLAGITGQRYYLVEDNGEVLCGDKAEAVKKCIERGRKIVSDQKNETR